MVQNMMFVSHSPLDKRIVSMEEDWQRASVGTAVKKNWNWLGCTLRRNEESIAKQTVQ